MADQKTLISLSPTPSTTTTTHFTFSSLPFIHTLIITIPYYLPIIVFLYRLLRLTTTTTTTTGTRVTQDPKDYC